jgi:hypothetical protein
MLFCEAYSLRSVMLLLSAILNALIPLCPLCPFGRLKNKRKSSRKKQTMRNSLDGSGKLWLGGAERSEAQHPAILAANSKTGDE